MIKGLLFTLLIIPIFSLFFANIKKQNFFNKFAEGTLPILFLINLLGLYHQYSYESFNEQLSLFYFDNLIFFFLFLLGFLLHIVAEFVGVHKYFCKNRCVIQRRP